MAIGKWNPFAGTSQSATTNNSSQQQQPVVPEVTPPDDKSFGLENFGNTCYANSVLQALYFCSPFRDLIVQYPDPSVPDVPFPPPPPSPVQHSRPKPARKFSVTDSAQNSNPNTSQSLVSATSQPTPIPPSPPTLMSALRSLYVHISRNPADKGIVAPKAFIDKLKELNELFRGGQHQDAHEFLNFLLNRIVEEMEVDRRAARNASPVRNGNAIAGPPLGAPSSQQNPVLDGLSPPSDTISPSLQSSSLDVPPPTNANGDSLSSSTPTGTSPPTIGASSQKTDDLSRSIATLASSNAPTVPSAAPSTAPTTPAPSFTSTLVHRLFEGVLTSETRCLTCETVSSRDECFLDLSIDIEQNSSVTACLRQFSASEMLCQKNKFFCDSCCDLQEAEKRMKIKKLPNILALHLKRFKYQEDTGRYIKLAYRVVFPVELRLFNTVDDSDDPDRLYELFAVVVHIGNGPHHGHYVSLIKAREAWLLFDDDTVEIIKESDIARYFGDSNSGSAYVLYYQAKDLDVAALGVQVQPPVTAAAASNTLESPSPVPVPSSEEHSTNAQAGISIGGVAEPESSPAVPPGLTEEPEAMEAHELPQPGTPSLSNSPLLRPSPGDSDTKLHLPPHLHPSISAPYHHHQHGGGYPHSNSLPLPLPESGPSTPVSPSTPGASTSTFGNFLNTFRHTPSKAGRLNGFYGKDRDKDKDKDKDGGKDKDKDKDRDVPPLPPPKPKPSGSVDSHSHDQHVPLTPRTPSRSSHSKPLPTPNGKEKEKDGHHKHNKMGTWLRRKSVRLGEDKTGVPSSSSHSQSTNLSERTHSLGKEKEKEREKDKDEGPAAWFRHATRLGRRASETEFHDPHTVSSPHFFFNLSSPSHSNSPFSLHSSHNHASTMNATMHHTMSMSTPGSPNLYPVPEHKKSESDLPASASRKEKERVEVPERPATAGGQRKKTRPKSEHVPPVPPIPPPKNSVPGHGPSSSSNASSGGGAHGGANGNGAGVGIGNGSGNGKAVRRERDGAASPKEFRHTVHGGDTERDHVYHSEQNRHPVPGVEDSREKTVQGKGAIPNGYASHDPVSMSNYPHLHQAEGEGQESESSHLAPSLGVSNSNGTSSSLGTAGGGSGHGLMAPSTASGPGSRVVSGAGSTGSGSGSGSGRRGGGGESHPPPTTPHHGKKATRKLSFTAPMLGFGRRDKDKHHHKDKEHKDKDKDKHDVQGKTHSPGGTATFFT
ncbi:hypothetical protein NLI96_g8513 [Meripilus lineatus]|uniref:ubiquitinyl hydrolase 1 n=1 Tax=Meripilus lineatus TaxID=2056292 RepID=A0AAD5YBX7_9APHY|nr:hypothetical protein NLI96_g8513 [Physisporinus lineatus]